MIDRVERVCHPSLTQRAWLIFFHWLVGTDGCGNVGIHICTLSTIGQMLFLLRDSEVENEHLKMNTHAQVHHISDTQTGEVSKTCGKQMY